MLSLTRSSWCRRARVGELAVPELPRRALTKAYREGSDSESGPVNEEDQQTWFRNMWEGKEEQAAQPVESEETSASAPATASEENDFNDNDDDFGDDFDDFAEGQEAEDDFGDFDDADETPMAPEPHPQVQTQKPDFLAGLVSSVQSNVYYQQPFLHD
jgi:hypothetical protein